MKARRIAKEVRLDKSLKIEGFAKNGYCHFTGQKAFKM
jgi:hypothetical protein